MAISNKYVLKLI